MTRGPEVLIVVPAFNEEASVGLVVKEVRTALPQSTVLVVDDGSADHTAAEARSAGAEVAVNPFNLGVGGAMRVGFRYAQTHGFDVLVQVDADGQHDPRDVAALLAALDDDPGPQTVIGARFAGVGAFAVPRLRRLAMRLLARYLSRVTHTALSDVTSGFRAHNRSAIELFARSYPAAYLSDTIESLMIVADAGGRVHQVPVSMRPRLVGTSTQSSLQAAQYLLRVLLVLVLSVFRRQPRAIRHSEKESP